MNALRIFVVLVLLVAAPLRAGAQSIVRDAEIEAMMRAYSEPLFEAAGLNPDAVATYIVADSSINAFVMGGQNVFLHTGIIIEADTPNELIGVIAHETGHIEGAHLARLQDGARTATVPLLISLAAGVLAAAAGEGGAAATLIASSQQFALLTFFQYTQGQESSADQAAVRLLRETGQSPEGLLKFFDRFRYNELLDERRDPYFRSHPLSSRRVESLRPAVEERPYADFPDSPEHIQMLARAQAKIIGFFYSQADTFKVYPADETTTEALYAHAFAYEKAGLVNKALDTVRELISREPENPYFHELYGQILSENGRKQEALEPLREAVRLKPDAALLHLLLAEALISMAERDNTQEPLDEAEVHLREAQKYERNNAFMWNLRGRLHDERGETVLARLALAEQVYNSDPARALALASYARANLDRSSSEWVQADDIVTAVRARMAMQENRRR